MNPGVVAIAIAATVYALLIAAVITAGLQNRKEGK